jgi:hypothetical protein
MLRYLTEESREDQPALFEISANPYAPNVSDLINFSDETPVTVPGSLCSTVSINFKEMRIRPTHYCIKIVQGRIDGWSFEGLDDSNWKQLHHVKNASLVSSAVESFPVKTSVESSQFRIRHHSKKNANMTLVGLEIFGTLLH